MTTDATTSVHNHLVPEELRFDGINPIEKLGFVLIVHLDELLPLPAEGGGCLFLDRGQGWRKQPRHPAPNWEAF
jgi:hypothetical protein